MGTPYSDTIGRPLHEWAKLPWFGPGSKGDAQLYAQRGAEKRSIRDVIAELIELVDVAGIDSAAEGERVPIFGEDK